VFPDALCVRFASGEIPPCARTVERVRPPVSRRISLSLSLFAVYADKTDKAAAESVLPILSVAAPRRSVRKLTNENGGIDYNRSTAGLRSRVKRWNRFQMSNLKHRRRGGSK